MTNSNISAHCQCQCSRLVGGEKCNKHSTAYSKTKKRERSFCQRWHILGSSNKLLTKCFKALFKNHKLWQYCQSQYISSSSADKWIQKHVFKIIKNTRQICVCRGPNLTFSIYARGVTISPHKGSRTQCTLHQTLLSTAVQPC